LLNSGFLAVDQRIRIVMLGRVIFEMRLAKAARVLGFDDLVILRVQLDVVAHTTAEGAGRVFYNVDVAHRIPAKAGLKTCATHAVVAQDFSPATFCRPDRAATRTFNQAPGRGSCP